jgi:hypothetical protein
MKEIKWLFNNNIDNNYYEVKLNLYKVTEDNSTVVLRTIKSEKNMIYNIEKIQKNIINIFSKIEELLENETINLLRYESGIIKGQMNDIYNIISDSNKISAIAPNNDIMLNYNLKDLKIGEKTQILNFNLGHKNINILRIRYNI